MKTVFCSTLYRGEVNRRVLSDFYILDSRILISTIFLFFFFKLLLTIFRLYCPAQSYQLPPDFISYIVIVPFHYNGFFLFPLPYMAIKVSHKYKTVFIPCSSFLHCLYELIAEKVCLPLLLLVLRRIPPIL